MAGVKGMKHRRPVPKSVTAVIETTKICKRLQRHVLGEINLSSTQVRSAQILLNKTMPNLNAIDFQGNIDMNANVTHIEEVIIEVEK